MCSRSRCSGSACRCSRPCTRAGAPRASILRRRSAMNEVVQDIVVACKDLTKIYQGPQPVPVLLGVDLAIRAGERIAITGRSGSGKSTLLHLLGGLDAPTSGTVMVQGKPFSPMAEPERGKGRNRALGFAWHRLRDRYPRRRHRGARGAGLRAEGRQARRGALAAVFVSLERAALRQGSLVGFQGARELVAQRVRHQHVGIGRAAVDLIELGDDLAVVLRESLRGALRALRIAARGGERRLAELERG